MKCKLLIEREVIEFHPGTNTPHAPPQLVAQCVRRDGRLFAPAGTIIDDPQCFWIVLLGQADPADDECREKTKLTAEKQLEMKQATKELALGIHPEDRAKFRAGEIEGYKPDGSYIPGPNWKPKQAGIEE